MNSPEALHLYIEGRVQGVGYPYATQKKALALGLTGWVRNLPDVHLEVFIEGAEDLQDQLLPWCYEGPSFSYVFKIDIERESVDDSSDYFFIR